MTDAFGFVEVALAPFDVARRAMLQRAARVRWIRDLLRKKETRVPLLASLSVIVSFAMTRALPGWLLLAGPLLLGVPHLASDFRYLVLRRRLPKRWLALLAVGSVLLFAWRIVEIERAWALPYAALEAALGFTWALTGLWLGAADCGRWGRAALATIPLAASGCLAVCHPIPTRVFLAYGHNVMALAVWFLLFRRHKRRAALPLVLVAAGVWAIARQPMPGHVLLFLQAVHYSVWLAWIPQEELPGNATLTFRMSARAAWRDFGPLGTGLIVLGTTAMVIAAPFGAHRVRDMYLFLSGFHAYLEIACLAFSFGQAALTPQEVSP